MCFRIIPRTQNRNITRVVATETSDHCTATYSDPWLISGGNGTGESSEEAIVALSAHLLMNRGAGQLYDVKVSCTALGTRHDIDSILFNHDQSRPATEWVNGCGESPTSSDHACAVF